uniref:Uncharacterized protein n=1 Tax=Coccolithus braarudii TaxID=221442 RepID=A0A7S0Q8U7_9EUKA|mmetsp:Transcript_49663/g.106109  ORF Transcript_49663/g.106109 Transcript_49663/m.106109 type:complete len:305 (+) Transcript_49663:117-1031(+)
MPAMRWLAHAVLYVAALVDGLQLLTFDLDDTLFPCGVVVERANAALVASMRSQGVHVSSADDITERIRGVRSQSPIKLTYSEMRRRAIASMLSGEDVSARATVLFDTWLEERHRAANELLCKGAVEAIRESVCAHPHAVVGAVTNGRGDPLCMPDLCSMFDFTVSGEDEDVFPDRKPSPAIYEHTLQRAAAAREARGLEASDAILIAASWVHVGDCLVNDVDAAKTVGAHTVWLDLNADPGTKTAWLDKSADGSKSAPDFSTASEDEVTLRRKRANEVLRGGRVDVRIEHICELPVALRTLGFN